MSHEPATPAKGSTTSIDSADALTLLAGELASIAERVDDLDEDDVEDVADERLAGLLEELKDAENAIEDARKDIVEEEMDERTEVGESIGDFTRVQGHNKYIPDEEAAIASLKAAGVDPREVMTLKASAVAEACEESGLNPDAHVGRATYTYYM